MLKRQLFQVIFCQGHQQYVYFLQRSIYYRMMAASSSVAMVGATPHTFFLKVPWVNKQLASSDFTLRKKLKVAGVNYGNNGAGRTS
jgi:hypothetical protein